VRTFPAQSSLLGNFYVRKGLCLLAVKFVAEMRTFGTAPATDTCKVSEESESRLGVCLRFAEVDATKLIQGDARILHVGELGVIVPVAGPEFPEGL
jgi:hypothetical protein